MISNGFVILSGQFKNWLEVKPKDPRPFLIIKMTVFQISPSSSGYKKPHPPRTLQ
jgi:hypothetical protein